LSIRTETGSWVKTGPGRLTLAPSSGGKNRRVDLAGWTNVLERLQAQLMREAREEVVSPGDLLDTEPLDPLRMPHAARVHAFWRMLERCVKENPRIDVTLRVREHSVPGSKRYYCTYYYTFELPDFMATGVMTRYNLYDRPTEEALFAQALRRKDVSYYAAILALHNGYGRLGSCSGAVRKALLDGDRAAWEANHEELVKPWFARYGNWSDPQGRYERWLFLSSLSAANRYKLCFGELPSAPQALLARLDPDSKTPREEVQGWSMEAVANFIDEHAKRGEHKPTTTLPADEATHRVWASILVDCRDGDMPRALDAFLHYAGVHGHAALYTDMMLALFVVRGYEYDAATRRYTVSPLGHRLLDYAIEHPIPELLRVTKALRERWDADALMKTVSKHHPDVDDWDAFDRKISDSAPRERQE
jgi:hypothetical protein